VSSPLVSVCIPARNHARFVREAVESALCQGVEVEVLVHDDASTDGTASVVESIGDRRVRMLRHPAPLGVAGNRNSLVRAARGRYLAWLDADDAYVGGALERQVEVLEANPEVALVHGAPQIVDGGGSPLRPFRRPFKLDTIERGSDCFRELILSNEMTTSTVVVRGGVQASAGPFVARGPSSSDWEMWLRVALEGDVAYTATPVARYRQHRDTISHATAGWRRLRSDAEVVRGVLRSEAGRLEDPDRVGDRAHAALAAKALCLAGDLATRGERSAAVRAVGLAARFAPRLFEHALPRLMLATASGDDYESYLLTKAMLGRLAERLRGTRFGRSIQRQARSDPTWEEAIGRMAAAVRRVTPRHAFVGTVTKWDPTLLHLSAREGIQFPDRRSLPDGYPRDSRAAVAHLERLRGEGMSHLVVPRASMWWLDHYDGLAERLPEPAHADDDCLIFDLAA
jgi:glycosyltransferase involved in cell wall biosynthesis